MAVRTIAPGGGNINVAATYVENLVPGVNDRIVGNAASGQLTCSATITIQRMDLTDYANTLTMTSGQITISQANGATIFGVGMTFSGNPNTGAILNFTGNNRTVAQNTSSPIPRVRFNNAQVALTDMTVINIDLSQSSFRSDGFTMSVAGDFMFVGGFAQSLAIFGTTNYLLTSLSGRISAAFGPGASTRTITITGNYETRNMGLQLLDSNTLNYTTGTASSNFNIIVRPGSAGSTNTINVNQPNAKLWLVNRPTTTGQNLNTINLAGPLVVDFIGCETESFSFTNANSFMNWVIVGGTVSTNALSIGPAFHMNSVSNAFPATVNLTNYRALTLRLDRLFTHTIGRLELSGGGLAYPVAGPDTLRPLIRSNSPGNQVSINLLSKTQSQIINYDFTDVNAVGQEIIAIRGTITNSTNVSNVYPSGGGGGGGGSFVYLT